MANPTEAERMVWKWQEQFRYKLNIPDDKIEELQQQVTTALLVARQAQREADAWIARKFEQPCAHTACTCSDAVIEDGQRIATAILEGTG